MIKLFHGDDTFESYVNASKDVKKIAAEKNIDVKIINADSLDKIDEFTQEIEGIGMFSNESVILAKRLLKNKTISKFLEDNYDRLNNYSIVIWNEGKADGRSKIVKAIGKNKGAFNYELPKEWQIGSWIQSILKAKKVDLTREQINFIAERLGTNKWIILNAINKIKLYLTLENSISNEELNKILGFDVNGDIWKFLDFFGNKDIPNMLSEFEKLMQFEDNSQYLIAMLERELVLLFKVLNGKDKGIDYKSLGLHPFVLQKTIKKSSHFNKVEVKDLLNKLLDLDLRIKSGAIDEITGLSLYLSEL